MMPGDPLALGRGGNCLRRLAHEPITQRLGHSFEVPAPSCGCGRSLAMVLAPLALLAFAVHRVSMRRAVELERVWTRIATSVGELVETMGDSFGR